MHHDLGPDTPSRVPHNCSNVRCVTAVGVIVRLLKQPIPRGWTQTCTRANTRDHQHAVSHIIFPNLFGLVPCVAPPLALGYDTCIQRKPGRHA